MKRPIAAIDEVCETGAVSVRRRLLPDAHQGPVPRPQPQRKEVALVHTGQFEKLDNSKAELQLANRLRNFARGGLPPERVLRLTIRPDLEVRVEAPEAPETATAA